MLSRTRLTYFRVVLSLLWAVAGSFVVYALFSLSLKCAWNVKMHVAAAACTVPLRSGVRCLDRFFAYDPLDYWPNDWLALYGSTMHPVQLRGGFRTIFFCLVCGLLQLKKKRKKMAIFLIYIPKHKIIHT